MGNPKANDGSILRSDLDGRNMTTIVPPGGTFTPKQLQIEKTNGKLYWSRPRGHARDARQPRRFAHRDARRYEPGRPAPRRPTRRRWCVGIAVDADGGKFYWTQKGRTTRGRAPLHAPTSTIPAGQTAADSARYRAALRQPAGADRPRPRSPQPARSYWTDRGDPPRGNTVNRAPLDAAPGKRHGSRNRFSST